MRSARSRCRNYVGSRCPPRSRPTCGAIESRKGADRYAAALSTQPLLTSIFISGSDLTDAGLKHLTRMPSLVELDIRETRVTAVGVEALQKALPDCKIHANPPAAKAAE